MKYIILLLICFTCFAQNHLQKMNNELIKKIGLVDNARDKKVGDLMKEHLINLEKLKVFYTKKGDLDNALEVKAAIESLDMKPQRKQIKSLKNTVWIFVHNNQPVTFTSEGYAKGTRNK